MSEHGDAIMTHTPGVLGHGMVQAVGTRMGWWTQSHQTWTRYSLGDDNAGIRWHNRDSPVGARSRAALIANLVYTNLYPLDRPMYVPVPHARAQQGGVPWSAGQNQAPWSDEPALPLWLAGRLMALRHQQPQAEDGAQQSPREEAQPVPHFGA